MVTQSPRLRALALAVSSVLLASAAAVAVPMAASADTAPAAGTPATVSSDALPAPQIDGVVWTQKVVGNTVYVGGSFTTARPAGSAAGTNTVARANMLAYNLTTGALIGSFAPTFNGQVRAIDASPDGSRIYVGGDFNQVSGQSRPFIAALDPTTGSVLPFRAVVNAPVYSVAASGPNVFIGGVFTAVNSTARARTAQLTASAALTAFAPAVGDRIVRALVVSPDGSKVVLGGSFSSVNGSTTPGQGLAAIDVASGQLLNWAATSQIYNHGDKAAITSMSSDGTSFYGTGYVFGSTADGNIEGTFNASWADGSFQWVEDCHGDTYSVAALDDVVYTASHAHYCGSLPNGFDESNPRSYQHGLAFTKAATSTLKSWNGGEPYTNWGGTPAPSLLTWYPDFTIGSFTGQSQAAWSVTTTKGYVLYGGEFPTVNGTAQQGLVRFAVKSIAPNTDGPRLSGTKWVASAVSLAPGSVRISWGANWDRDNSSLIYNVYRNGGTQPVYTTTALSEARWLRPQLGFVDKGLTAGARVSYVVRATDPSGNVASSATVTTTVSSAVPSAYSNAVIADGAADFWRFGEPTGPKVYDWVGYSDLTATAGVTFGQRGAITGDANTAAAFSGDDGVTAATSGTPAPGPQTFSVEAWFKTTTTSGGKIVGYGNAQSGRSNAYDRQIYMDGDGRVYFGVYNGDTQTIRTGTGLNDGTWHHAVGTLSAAGMGFYVDGKRVGARASVTSSQPFDGYWRVGGDSTGYWPGDTGSGYFAGSIDDVAVYPTVLSSTAVKNHWQQSGLAGPATVPTDKYGAAVYAADPDLFWRLGDALGTTTVKDASGNGQTGAVDGNVAFGGAGGVAGSTGTSASFAGDYGVIATSQPRPATNRYSLELWFNTTTTRGGKLIGFGNQPTGTSSQYDKHVWMLDSGQLRFGVWTGFTNTATSAKSYNDGRWHQMTATQGADGMKLYVDGQLVGDNPQTDGDRYDGYWRVGGDTHWGDASSQFFGGSMQDVAVYDNVLTAAQVAQHYALGGSTNQKPTAAFTTVVQDRTVAFDGSGSTDADGTIASATWDFGDGTTGTGTKPSHTYAKDGSYSVVLTVTDDAGASDSITKIVVVVRANTAPTASFTSSVTGLVATFDASASTDADGTVASYAWDFGDGTTGTGTKPSHTYAKDGSYSVVLTVTDDAGTTASVTKPVTIVRVNTPPTASFTSSVTGLVATFDASASTDADGTVASYAWDFGDGTTGTGTKPSHTYAKDGSYSVVLTVTDDAGTTASVTKPVTIVRVNTPPTAVFTSSVTALVARFDASASTDADGTVASYAWDFGDDTTGAGVSPSHTYAKAGSYSVALTVTDDQGATARRTDQLVLVAANSSPVAAFTATPSGTSVAFDASGSTDADGAVASYAWDFGDGTTGTGVAPTRVYAKGGTYSVVLTVTDDRGATDSTTRAVKVVAANQPPVASFTANVSGATVSVDGGGSSDPDGTVASYAWDFGDGAVATGSTALRTYTASGTYTVKLTVLDDSGATASTTRSVQVTVPVVQNHLAQDGFGRTVAGGFGTADAGGAWTVAAGAASFAVGSGTGTVTTKAGSTLTVMLGSVSSTSVDVSTTVALSKLPVGANAYFDLVGRRVGTADYNARLIVTPAGAVTLYVQRDATSLKSVKLTDVYTPGTQLRLRLQVTGTNPTTVRAKAWTSASVEPTAWGASATDTTVALQAAGSIGLRTYVGASTSNGPIVTTIDDLVADEVK